jgi:D-glycero-D-manno-heptose 1,7-bisphosphate phosphatase
MKVIFLDRDGVINQEVGYLHKVEDFKFIDGIFKACKYFQSLG